MNFQQRAVTLELELSLGTFDPISIGGQGPLMPGAMVGLNDTAIGEPVAAVVILTATILAMFPGHAKSPVVVQLVLRKSARLSNYIQPASIRRFTQQRFCCVNRDLCLGHHLGNRACRNKQHRKEYQHQPRTR